MIEKKIYPSSSGFAFGTAGFYEVEYNSACYRFQVASLGSPRSPLDSISVKIGSMFEEWYAERMGEAILERERPIRVPYLNGEVIYSGRMDFLMKNGEIHETKASRSKNFLYSVIRKKKVKLSHLAQLISYMVHQKVSNGKIICGFYKEKTLELQAVQEFDVRISDDGEIFVNDEQTKFRVNHAITYLMQLVNLLAVETISGRPFSTDFITPCSFCPLKNICDSFDQNKLTEDEFKTQAKKILGEKNGNAKV